MKELNGELPRSWQETQWRTPLKNSPGLPWSPLCWSTRGRLLHPHVLERLNLGPGPAHLRDSVLHCDVGLVVTKSLLHRSDQCQRNSNEKKTLLFSIHMSKDHCVCYYWSLVSQTLRTPKHEVLPKKTSNRFAALLFTSPGSGFYVRSQDLCALRQAPWTEQVQQVCRSATVGSPCLQW